MALGERLSADCRKLHKIDPLLESNENIFFAVLFTFQESR
jgi:hypothetical protein